MKHIWTDPDWPNFRWNAAALAGPLAEVRYKQGRFLGRMSGIGFDLSQGALLETLAEDVIKSSEIEGVSLNPRSVRSSIARKLGIDQGGLGLMAPADRGVDGIVEVVIDASERSAEPLTADRLFGWHGALFPTGRSGFQKIDVAQWRKHGMTITDGHYDYLRQKIFYTAPPPEKVPAEMERFLDWFNADADEDPVLKASLAHYWFVAIHPFDDGNGRIARAIADMALARSDRAIKRFYSMSASIKSVGTEYYSALEETSNGSLDITTWHSFFIDCLDRSINLAENTLEKVLSKARFWEQHQGKALSERQNKVINRLLDGFEGKITSKKWAKLINSSQDTAIRDISDLIEKGILTQSASGGRSTSYDLVMPPSSFSFDTGIKGPQEITHEDDDEEIKPSWS